MKYKTIIIEEFECTKQACVQKLITGMVQEPGVNLTIRFRYYQVPLAASILNAIADTIKAVGKEYEFVVDLVLETDQWKSIKRLRKLLNQYAISVELKVSDQIKPEDAAKYTKKILLEKALLPCKDYQEFKELYTRWKIVGMPIQSIGYELSLKEYLEFFEEWIHDAKAAWYIPFEDVISSMLTGVHIDTCEHSSCMGKYLYLDKENQVYFCEKKLENTKMYSLDQNTPEDIFNKPYSNAVYSKTIDFAIKKRNQCQSECPMFGLCRGGCPLVEADPVRCQEYAQKVSRVSVFFEKEMKDAFVNIENPCMRQLYLSLIAYGFDFAQE